MADIEIEIDGKKITAAPNKMVIQVADDEGIYIPRFCYHKHLSIAANCRMCLVEVEKSPKALPACATPIAPGMKVFTRSQKAIAAQRAVMEFLLINHPLDCPICDQGGECELQDLSMGYGKSKSYYVEGKRSVADEDLGPLISTEMTRCIQCTRCVRYGSEVAGMRELGAIGRGEELEISTYIHHAMHSEVSGNIIDLCPVGALTSKPYRFTARPWELQQFPTIAPHDCLGSNIFIHTRNNQVMRAVPRECDSINQTWSSDRDRFSYEALNHPDRLTAPLIRVNGKLQETTWQKALEVAADALQKIVDIEDGQQLATLAHPSSTLEEMYLLQKLFRMLGSPHIDHRLRQSDFSDQDSKPFYPKIQIPIAAIENCDVIILIGSNLQKEQPLAALRIRKAALRGAKVIIVNPVDYQFNFAVAMKKIVAPHDMVAALSELNIHEMIKDAKNPCVILGALAINHPEYSDIYALASQFGPVSELTEGANAAGAWIAGMLPHRGPGQKSVQVGLNAHSMFLHPRKVYMLLNVEPDLDCGNPALAIQALDQADAVIALSLYRSPLLDELADVYLPIAPFTETEGTFVNAEGRWQSFNAVTTPYLESRPAWKVLRVLGNFLHREGFEYTSCEQIRKEIKAIADHAPKMPQTKKEKQKSHITKSDKLSRVGEIPIYATDSIVRRAASLQLAQPIVMGNLDAARIHPDTAKQYELKEMDLVIFKQQQYRMKLPVSLDERIPLNAVQIYGGISATTSLPHLFGEIELEKI